MSYRCPLNLMFIWLHLARIIASLVDKFLSLKWQSVPTIKIYNLNFVVAPYAQLNALYNNMKRAN